MESILSLTRQTLEILTPIGITFVALGYILLKCAALFIPLAYMLPGSRKQPVFHRGMIPDLLYWFCGPVFYTPIGAIASGALVTHLYTHETIRNLNQIGLPPLCNLPLWLQCLLMLLFADIMQYWLHRFFHRSSLWKYHAIHHSSKHPDWLTTVRFHPVNILLYSTLANVIVGAMGFRPEAALLLIPFNTFFSPLVHANLNWTWGPFRYVLASPVFHRWHHTYVEEGGDRNFAPTFPFLDILFGTYYMPKDKLPEVFGIENSDVPESFFGQLAYPFKRIGKD